jgi:hypothetical protein
MFGQYFREMTRGFFKEKFPILKSAWNHLVQEGRIPVSVPEFTLLPASQPKLGDDTLQVWQLTDSLYGITGTSQTVATLENDMFEKWNMKGGTRFHDTLVINAGKATLGSGGTVRVDGPLRIVEGFQCQTEKRTKKKT